MARARSKTTSRTAKSPKSGNRDRVQPFIEHVHELRRRLMYVAFSVVVWSAAAYAIEQKLIDWLLKPSHGQNFIYTSPIGGINFLFKVCLYAGVAFSIPVIVYQFLRYVEPLLRYSSAKFIYYGSAVSGVLALCGMSFGYFVGLPAALNFLLHQFHSAQIHPLLTIDEYMSFVTVYMFGSALMFQVPLIVLFINRIRPLTPQQLFKKERWVVIFAIILAAVMNPTPNVIDQFFIALPIVLTYQLSIGIIWWQQRYSRGHRVRLLHEADAKARAERQQRAQQLRPLMPVKSLPPLAAQPLPAASVSHAATSQPARATYRPFLANGYSLPRSRYFDGPVIH